VTYAIPSVQLYGCKDDKQSCIFVTSAKPERPCEAAVTAETGHCIVWLSQWRQNECISHAGVTGMLPRCRYTKLQVSSFFNGSLSLQLQHLFSSACREKTNENRNAINEAFSFPCSYLSFFILHFLQLFIYFFPFLHYFLSVHSSFKFISLNSFLPYPELAQIHRLIFQSSSAESYLSARWEGPYEIGIRNPK
jgi:hypothetical protein